MPALAFVLTENITDFASTDADVACGGIGELTDVTVKLGGKALAETHDLGVGLAVGVKVGAALCTAHGESGQGIFEYLLEAEELNDGKVDRGVETNAALVRPDSGVELYTVAAVDMGNTPVVNPGNTEHDNTLGLYETLDEACLLPLGMFIDNKLKTLEHFTNRLQKFGLVGVTLFYGCVDSFKILICDHGTSLLANIYHGVYLWVCCGERRMRRNSSCCLYRILF